MLQIVGLAPPLSQPPRPLASPLRAQRMRTMKMRMRKQVGFSFYSPPPSPDPSTTLPHLSFSAFTLTLHLPTILSHYINTFCVPYHLRSHYCTHCFRPPLTLPCLLASLPPLLLPSHQVPSSMLSISCLVHAHARWPWAASRSNHCSIVANMTATAGLRFQSFFSRLLLSKCWNGKSLVGQGLCVSRQQSGQEWKESTSRI